MRNLISLVVLAALTTYTHAQDSFELQPYLSIHTGISFLDDTEVQGTVSNDIDFDDAASFGGAIGIHLDPVRLEFEITHRNHDIDSITVPALAGIALPIDGDVDLTTFMFNVFYDFQPEFVPEQLGFYVGGGIGVSLIDVELKSLGASASDDDSILSIQLLLGASYKIAEKVSLTAQYRLLFTEEPDIGGSDLDEALMDGIEFGIRIDF